MTHSYSGLRPSARPSLRSLYLDALALAFALFNSARLASYLPTLWAIQSSGDSSQHSLWTWGCWLGANLTTAAWVRERNGGRLDRVATISLGNALMCASTIVLILVHRGAPTP